jgi:predicted RNA-binding Zn-ribbon protein involved in translation (DUF1610 family)
MPESDKPVSFRCPECGSRELTRLSESECVTIYKCSRCGRLQAPVKNQQPDTEAG